MLRNLTPLAAVFALATAAHAQTTPTYSRTYTTSNGYGTTTTTIQAPATPAGVSAVGMIANQTVYGGFPSYSNGVPSYGANCPPNYNNGYAGYNGGYTGYTVPNYGYGYSYGCPPPPAYPCPAPPPAPYYGVPPQAYYIPGQTTYIPQSNTLPWVAPIGITSVPQVIVTPGTGYYGATPYNYGWQSQTNVVNGGISYQRGGLNVSVGGTSVTHRR